MEPIDGTFGYDAPYRLPSRHPSAGHSPSPVPAHVQVPESPAQLGEAQVLDAGDHQALEIKRRQEALMVTYLIHRAGR
jgi:hypothetical protein